MTLIDRDENSYEVQENILLPVFWKKKTTEKTVSLHRKEKVTKKSNTGKAKKTEKDQRSMDEVKRLKMWEIILNISLPLYFEIVYFSKYYKCTSCKGFMDICSIIMSYNFNF